MSDAEERVVPHLRVSVAWLQNDWELSRVLIDKAFAVSEKLNDDYFVGLFSHIKSLLDEERGFSKGNILQIIG